MNYDEVFELIRFCGGSVVFYGRAMRAFATVRFVVNCLAFAQCRAGTFPADELQHWDDHLSSLAQDVAEVQFSRRLVILPTYHICERRRVSLLR